ncbi:hypothetical protein EMCRGX_G014146, partial [Ephydatia muelleri]
KRQHIWDVRHTRMASSCSIVPNAKALIIANSVLSAVACVASLVTVATVLCLKVYRKFLYRLTLYLATTSFLYVLTLGLSVLPMNVNGTSISVKNGWNTTCALIGGAHQFFYFSNTAAIVWICVYTTKLGFRRNQSEMYQPLEEDEDRRLCAVLSSHKGEVVGCILLVLLPAALFWYPYTEGGYGAEGVWCWMDASNSQTSSALLLAFRVLSRVPSIITTLLCVGLLLSVQLRLCYLGTHWAYWRPIKTVAIILAYPILFAIPSIGSMLHVFLSKWSKDCSLNNDMEMFFLSLFYFSSISLPVLLLLQWDIRLTISRKYGDLQIDNDSSVSRETSITA